MKDILIIMKSEYILRKAMRSEDVLTK